MKTKQIEKFIRDEMKRTGYTQVKLARRLGITQQGFSKKLGRSNFSFTEMAILFRTFQTSEEGIIRLCNEQQ